MTQIHYIWVDFITQLGSHNSKLAYNGRVSLVSAKNAIDSTTKEQYLRACSSNFFRNNSIRIEIAAQNIHTGETLYKRIINL